MRVASERAMNRANARTFYAENKDLSQKPILLRYTLIKTDGFKIEPIKARQKES